MKATLLSPSYPSSEAEKKEISKNLEKLGFKDVEDFSSKLFFNKWAGDIEERLSNFYQAWNSNSEVIFCTKGGSGAAHLVPLLNKKKLKRKKLLVGYSDITMLLNFINQKLGILSIHGPHFGKKLSQATLSALRDALQMKNYSIKFDRKKSKNPASEIEGRTIGGNLERLIQTLHFIDLDFRDKIVFLEEIYLTEHKIFNLLTFLKNYPGFSPKAIIFGNLGIKNKRLMKEMISYLFPNTPLIFDVKFGHDTSNIAIPIGANCRIDFDNGIIGFLFSDKDRTYSLNF